MPANRRKKLRGQQISKELEGLFLLGCGWNVVEKEKGLPWIREQWRRYGPAFLRSYHHEYPCWAEEFFGPPEDCE